jgi:HD superfamily phosphohydrolase YqeK
LALYLADYAEPLRTLDQAAEARSVLREQGFRAAVVYAAKMKLDYVGRQFTVDPTSAAFGTWVAEQWTE